jgi:hypothetical protein
MHEYDIRFVIELRLTGDMFVEADSIDEARAVAQQMLDNNVFDMDFTIYEGEVQSEDILWDQELFEVRVREVKEISGNGDVTLWHDCQRTSSSELAQ